MTFNELKKDVAMLGFESSVEDEECFVASLNRALDLLYIDRPVSNSLLISFSSPKISLKKEFIEHRSGETITLPLSGRCLSFRSSGNGECVVEDRTGASLILLNGKNQLTRTRLMSDGTLTFQGDYYYTISNLVVYEDLFSGKDVDIPEYSPRREISPLDYCDDFRAFAGLPTDSQGTPINEAVLRDGRITLPYDFTGDIYLTYYRLPRKASSDNPNERIDVSKECAALLPLLTASFLWLDDDPSKAQYYMSLYRDGIANIKRFSTIHINTEYRTNGWA